MKIVNENVGHFLRKWHLAWGHARLLLLVLLVGCSRQQEQQVPPVRVQAAVAEEKEVSLYVTAIGNLIEHSLVQIRPQVQGILLRAYVKQGQEVKKGDLLYEIDPSLYQAALDQAKGTLERNQATLEQAKITVQRNQDLVKNNYIPKLTFEQFETNVKTAEADVAIGKAAVETAEINLDHCKITSPIDGKISVFNIYPGTLVFANDPKALTEIRQLHPIDVQFSVPQVEFQKIQQVQLNWPLGFEVTLPFQEKKAFFGTVDFIDNHIDINTGTILLKGSIENKEKNLWPGEFANIRIFLKKVQAALIPASAVVTGTKGSFVYVVQSDKTVKATPVKTGEAIDANIIILEGLKAGDKVVTNGQLNLKNDSKVEIIP